MAVTEKQAKPVRRDRGLLLMLIAACPFGLIIWVRLFFAVQWSLSAAWTMAFGTHHDPVITASAAAAPVVTAHLVPAAPLVLAPLVLAPLAPAPLVAAPVLVAAPAFDVSRPALTPRGSGRGVIPD